MGIFDSIFGSSPQPAQQPQPQQTLPGNIPPGTGMPATPLPNTAPNGVVPEQKVQATPLDEFKDLWKNEPTDPNAKPVDKSMFGVVNGDDLMKSASTIDFTKVVTPELAQRIQAGGEDGFKATLEAMNKVQQLGYAQSAHASTVLIEQAIAKAREQFTAELPMQIRNHSATALIKENPIFSHPAAQPLIEMATMQLQTKYPNATPSELKEMAQNYVTSFADAMKPAPKVDAATQGQDWSKFLNGI